MSIEDASADPDYVGQLRQRLFADARMYLRDYDARSSAAFQSHVAARTADHWAAFGLYGSGYIFLNTLKAAPELLFQSHIFPYFWRSTVDQPLVMILHELFLSWRTLHPKHPLAHEGALVPAEFLVDLPAINDHYLAYHPVEQWVRQSIGVHYVPLGEMLFFMLAWQSTARAAQVAGLSAIWRDSVFQFSFDGTARSLPYESLWQVPEIAGSHLPEGVWLRHLAALDNHYIEDAPSAWRTLNEHTGASSTGAVTCRADWMRLGLLRDDTFATVSLRAFLQFSLVIAVHHGAAGADQIAASLNTVHGLQAIHTNDLSALHAACHDLIELLCVQHLSNSSHKSQPTVGEMLEFLHNTVRFPLIPYFYWNVLEPAERAHLAVPVWRSSTAASSLLARSQAPLMPNGAMRKMFASVKQPTVGVAVTAIRPSSDADWTINPEAACNDPEMTTFALLRDYQELLAHVPADEKFYLEFQQTLYNHRHAAYLNHEVMGPIKRLTSDYLFLLDELQLDFPEAYKRVCLRQHVMGPLTQYCFEELQLFKVFGGEKIEWQAKPIKPSEFVRLLAVVLGDPTCCQELQPLPRLGCTIAPAKMSLPVCVAINNDAEIVTDVFKTITVVARLTENAIAATFTAGRRDAIRVDIESTPNLVSIKVHDRGNGIPIQDHDRVFDLYYTTKVGAGGMGLYLVKQICKAANGTVHIERSDAVGTTFVVKLRTDLES